MPTPARIGGQSVRCQLRCETCQLYRIRTVEILSVSGLVVILVCCWRSPSSARPPVTVTIRSRGMDRVDDTTETTPDRSRWGPSARGPTCAAGGVGNRSGGGCGWSRGYRAWRLGRKQRSLRSPEALATRWEVSSNAALRPASARAGRSSESRHPAGAPLRRVSAGRRGSRCARARGPRPPR
jgi:hypothetical protein